MPSLGHKKSRSGCLLCRKRRVKCDELRPCTACKKHGEHCSLVAARPSAPASRPDLPALQPLLARLAHLQDVSSQAHTAPAKLPGEEAAARPRPLLPSPPPASSSSSSSPNAAESDKAVASNHTDQQWAMDLELMHHYSTEVFRTLPRAQELQAVWQREACRIAMSHHYLLHYILALSALHLACVNPGHDLGYVKAAAHHQSQGICEMRAALEHMSAANCHALFLTGCFVVMVHFGSLAAQPDEASPSLALNDVTELFVLIRGMSSVLDMWEDVLQTGCIAQLFRAKPAKPVSERSAEIAAGLRGLPPLLLLMRAHYHDASSSVIETEALNLCRTYEGASLQAPFPELRAMMTWPIFASSSYVQLLRNGSPASMAVVAYFCVIVHETESDKWFTRGWSSKVVRAIEARLPSDWKHLIAWPVQQTRRTC